jgi:DNA-binding ferritin-like protein (Dps family)
MTISELASKMIGDKRRWRAYKARTRQLPTAYRTTIKALERYLLCFGPVDGDTAASVFEDLATLFEQAATRGTPVREIVGDNPVEFVKTFLQSYPEAGLSTQERERLVSEIVAENPVVFEAFLKDYVTGGWVARERKRLNGAIERAEGRPTPSRS